MTVVAGMLAATLFGIFLIPALFVAVERLAGKGKGQSPPRAAAGDAAE